MFTAMRGIMEGRNDRAPTHERSILSTTIHSFHGENPVKKMGREGFTMIAIISTYPPRQCGIATFASHLRQGLRAAGAPAVPVIALVRDNDAPMGSGSPVAHAIHQDTAADYPLV